MLLKLRQVITCRLWVAMDRWYLSKDFFNFLIANQFDWVTMAKRNTALYRKEIESMTGRERFVPVRPLMLIKQVFSQLIKQAPSGLVGIYIPNIYMKMPYMTPNKKGVMKRKFRYTLIAVIVATRLKEDESPEEEQLKETEGDKPITYRGVYVLISNRADAPQEALFVYAKRWRIEVFFRRAKQELGMSKCHSTTEVHHHAHLQLLFTSDTLLGYAHWQLNKEKTSNDEGYTHGEMVRGLFHTRCQIRVKTFNKVQRIYLDIDTTVRQFARLIQLF